MEMAKRDWESTAVPDLELAILEARERCTTIPLGLSDEFKYKEEIS